MLNRWSSGAFSDHSHWHLGLSEIADRRAAAHHSSFNLRRLRPRTATAGTHEPAVKGKWRRWRPPPPPSPPRSLRFLGRRPVPSSPAWASAPAAAASSAATRCPSSPRPPPPPTACSSWAAASSHVRAVASLVWLLRPVGLIHDFILWPLSFHFVVVQMRGRGVKAQSTEGWLDLHSWALWVDLECPLDFLFVWLEESAL